jgi:hypothetical protein
MRDQLNTKSTHAAQLVAKLEQIEEDVRLPAWS